ncbi:neurogenic locus notch homolog protein 1 [Elysia marginata]|uniref:Neurogenic locus notch homolog protein 1 n=1 Tax=Elysia marginata TaxID=1093978 RepID=A0AAV4JWW5_9GAST|nr:neurogenic locus notch homolog protein 1 [Elysia marginata]
MLGRGVEKSNCHATVSRVSSFQVDIGQAVFDLMGTCICKRGWEGRGCSESVNDCAKNPCKQQECKDSHKGHVCVCNQGKRFVKGRCRDFDVQLYVLEQNPAMGEFMNVYIFYGLSLPYILNPLIDPDFVYTISINNKFVCKISFHASHVRNKKSNPLLDKLKINKYYHFYSHFQMRRSEPTLTSLEATPESQEYYAIARILASSNSKDDPSCLSNAKIPGTTPCVNPDLDCLRKKAPTKRRQDYHTFRVQLNLNGDECPNIYKFSWTYYRTSDNLKSDLCLTFKKME